MGLDFIRESHCREPSGDAIGYARKKRPVGEWSTLETKRSNLRMVEMGRGSIEMLALVEL